jgi:hypothetical protein
MCPTGACRPGSWLSFSRNSSRLHWLALHPFFLLQRGYNTHTSAPSITGEHSTGRSTLFDPRAFKRSRDQWVVLPLHSRPSCSPFWPVASHSGGFDCELLLNFFHGVSGGTTSGKTTVYDMIIQQLHDHRVILVNQVGSQINWSWDWSVWVESFTC